MLGCTPASLLKSDCPLFRNRAITEDCSIWYTNPSMWLEAKLKLAQPMALSGVQKKSKQQRFPAVP